MSARRPYPVKAQARSQAPRPFESVSRGAGDGTEHTGPDCQVCAEGRRMDAARSQPGGYAETPACSDCGYVSCQCGVAGARIPPRAGQPAEVYR